MKITRLALPLLLATASPALADLSTLLPRPAQVEPGTGALALGGRITIGVPANDPGARRAATELVQMLQRATGRAPTVVEGATATIRFVRAADGPAEGYALTVDSRGATITARDDAGLLYGATTLWQLAGPRTIPAVTIRDAPRFGWRGMMLDSARHYQSPAFIKRMIQWMALNKLNRLHWHLVDDQGWRLPIDRYPRLTQVGGWRVPASAAPAPPLPRTGGVYTKAEIRDIVAFAAARGITIVPEIEMPGHALSAIRAYPELGVGPKPPPGIESDWGVFPYLYNVDDRTFTFLENVLTEVMDLFPGRYIHIGGDEAVKDQWRADPRIQARIKALGLADEEALQGWFVARIGTFLAAHGRTLIGWDEILKGAVPASATVMAWTGVEGATKAAAAGHDTILAAAPTLYFDNIEASSKREPIGRATVVSLADVYALDPLPASIPADQRHHVLGLQGTLWAEHMRSEARVEHQAFPRTLAIAELGWSQPQGHDYTDFARRAAVQLDRLKPFGLTRASTVAFTPDTVPLAKFSRAGTELATCQGKLALGLEDDYPAAGRRAHFLVDILAPCWRWDKAPIQSAQRIELDVGQIPFNYQVGKDRDAIDFRHPATPAGEFEIRDGCDGERLAVLPLASAVKNPGVTTLRAALPRRAAPANLCITYTARGPDPIWAVAAVRLVPAS